MRTHKPIDLVTELIRSPEPVSRANATVALGTLATAESTSILADVALTDKDADVRARAQKELRALGSKSESLKNVTAAIHDRLRDGETRVAAYVLLSQLRSLGLSIPLPKMTISERVSLAAGSRTGGTQTSYYRAVAMGSILASAAMLLFSVFVAHGLNPGELSILLFFASCLAPIFTMFVFSRLWRWKPVSMETDFLGAILVDSRLGLVAGSFLGILIAVVAYPFARSDSWKFVWVLIVSGIALLPAVRVGTAVAFATFKRRAVDMAYGRLAGAASGIAVITLLQLAFRSYKDPLAATGWLALAPISVAFATAITAVDHQEEAPQTPVFGRGANFVAGGVSLVVLACAILAAWPSKIPAPPEKQCDTTSTDSFPLTMGRDLVCNVQVSQPSQVAAALNKEATGNFRINWITSNVVQHTPERLVVVFLTASKSRFTVDPITVSATPSSVLISAGHALSQNFKQMLKLEPPAEKNYPSVEIDLSAFTPEMPVPDSVAPAQLNNWCRSQSVGGYASAPGVKQACQDAVTRSGNNVSFRDSRGLNRALNGDYAGAIEDFTAFVAASPDQIRVAERRRWIGQLQKHRNPFTPSELSRIASE